MKSREVTKILTPNELEAMEDLRLWAEAEMEEKDLPRYKAYENLTPAELFMDAALTAFRRLEKVFEKRCKLAAFIEYSDVIPLLSSIGFGADALIMLSIISPHSYTHALRPGLWKMSTITFEGVTSNIVIGLPGNQAKKVFLNPLDFKLRERIFQKDLQEVKKLRCLPGMSMERFLKRLARFYSHRTRPILPILRRSIHELTRHMEKVIVYNQASRREDDPSR